MNFRTKPGAIEAMQLDGHSTELIAWLRASGATYRMFANTYGDASKDVIFISTRAGELRAEPGDWIGRDASGAFYLFKSDAFEATYEPAPEGDCAPPGSRA
jgi:hypothetical protein